MKPVLVILAAGMGSRYGGLKQIDTVGTNNEAIIDFTIFDAIEAGFEKVVLIIRKEHQDAFENNLVHKFRNKIEVVYAYQDIKDLPMGINVPNDRVKPWGTSHALLACRDLVDVPFAICNADDFYGKDAFKKIYNFLIDNKNENNYAMVGYNLANTLSDHGSVTRGLCKIENNFLTDIKEISEIKKLDDKIVYSENDNWNEISGEEVVSMNFWGFKPNIFNKVYQIFEDEIISGIRTNPLKYEALLPVYVGNLIKNKKAEVSVLTSVDSWFGVTFIEDKPLVQAKIKEYKEKGLYPDNLWD